MPAKDTHRTSADRWSSWRRDTTVPVTPADTRLYRVVSDDDERIIGLGTTQLALIGARSSATDSAGDVLAFLDRTGFLRAWEYRISGNDLEAWSAEPVRELSLFARRTVHIEPFDPKTHLQPLGNTAREREVVGRDAPTIAYPSPTT